MQTDFDPRDLIGHKAVDRNGDKIGTVDEVYLDDATGQPEWAAVRTGIFGRDAFVPLTTSEFSGEELRVPYDKSLVKESPDFGVGQHLSPAQELQLYRYYGLDTAAAGQTATEEPGRPVQPDLDFGTPPATTTAKPLDFHSAEPGPTNPVSTVTVPSAVGTDTAAEATVRTLTTPAPAAATAATPLVEPKPKPQPTPAMPTPTPTTSAATTATTPAVEPKPKPQPTPAMPTPTPTGSAATSAPSAPVEVTCREERLDITTEWHALGTAKLRKYVTSEQVERRIPLVRERVRVERIPVSDAERATLTDKEIAEAVEEVTLREEHPIIRKYVAPVERVRLIVERYTTEEVVRDELRRERVEFHDSTTADPDPTTPATNGARPDSLRPFS